MGGRMMTMRRRPASLPALVVAAALAAACGGGEADTAEDEQAWTQVAAVAADADEGAAPVAGSFVIADGGIVHLRESGEGAPFDPGRAAKALIWRPGPDGRFDPDAPGELVELAPFLSAKGRNPEPLFRAVLPQLGAGDEVEVVYPPAGRAPERSFRIVFQGQSPWPDLVAIEDYLALSNETKARRASFENDLEELADAPVQHGEYGFAARYRRQGGGAVYDPHKDPGVRAQVLYRERALSAKGSWSQSAELVTLEPASELPPGLRMALDGMREGDFVQAIAPPWLMYGFDPRGRSKVPGDAIVEFRLELKRVLPAGEAALAYEAGEADARRAGFRDPDTPFAGQALGAAPLRLGNAPDAGEEDDEGAALLADALDLSPEDAQGAQDVAIGGPFDPEDDLESGLDDPFAGGVNADLFLEQIKGTPLERAGSAGPEPAAGDSEAGESGDSEGEAR